MPESSPSSEITEIGHVLHFNTNVAWGGGEDQVLRFCVATLERGGACTLFAHPDGALAARAAGAGVPVETATSRDRAYVRRRLREIQPALIHLNDSASIGLAAGAARRLGIPVIYSRRIASPLRQNWWSRRKYGPANLSAIIAVSETVREVMVATGCPSGRLHVVEDGLDFAEFADTEPLDEIRPSEAGGFIVGGVGSLTPKKNWGFLIETAAAVQARGVTVDWYLAGAGPLRAELEALAAELEVSGRVHLLGFRDDAERLIKSLDLLFFPSRREGGSVTIREAMAMSVPVVCVETPACVATLGGHGCVVRDGDVADAASRVIELLQHPERRAELALAARESARARFAFDTIFAETVAVYRSVLTAAGSATA